MNPEQNSVETQEKAPSQRYADEAQYILESVREVNANQLIAMINNNLLGPAIDAAQATNFRITEINPHAGVGLFTHEQSPGLELISMLMTAETVANAKNPDWVKGIPRSSGLLQAIQILHADPYTRAMYNSALKHRLEELRVQIRKGHPESGLVSPEDERLAEVVDDLGEVGVEATVEISEPVSHRDSFQPQEISPFAPEYREPQKSTPSLGVGDTFTIQVAVRNPSSGQITQEPKEFTVQSLKTVDGELMAAVVSDDDIIEKWVPVDALTHGDDYQKELIERLVGPHSSEMDIATEGPSDVGTGVLLGNEKSGFAMRGIVAGYSNEGGGSDMSSTYDGQRYAIVRSSDGALSREVPVPIEEVLPSVQATRAQFRSTLFKQPPR